LNAKAELGKPKIQHLSLISNDFAEKVALLAKNGGFHDENVSDRQTASRYWLAEPEL
jgi:hypothetical protein